MANVLLNKACKVYNGSTLDRELPCRLRKREKRELQFSNIKSDYALYMNKKDYSNIKRFQVENQNYIVVSSLDLGTNGYICLYCNREK